MSEIDYRKKYLQYKKKYVKLLEEHIIMKGGMQLITDPVPEKIPAVVQFTNLMSTFFAKEKKEIDHNEERINDLYHQVQGLAEFNRGLLEMCKVLSRYVFIGDKGPMITQYFDARDKSIPRIRKGEYKSGDFKDVRDQMK